MSANESTSNFTWTDNEVELLLGVIVDFKSQKEAEGYDWESVKTKYEIITESFLKRYPKDIEDNFPKSDPQKEFSKARIITKIKTLRLKFRKAVDAGRRSGGGRVVATFYDLCESIWGGSPAAEMIDGGIESSHNEVEEEVRDQDETNGNESSVKAAENYPNKRRSLVDHLKDQRNSKMRKKIPAEKIMIDIAKGDMSLKKEFMDQMKSMDKEQSAQLKTLNDTMVNLTKSISDSMSMFAQIQAHAVHNQSQVNPYPFQPGFPVGHRQFLVKALG